MRIIIPPLLAALICLCLTPFAAARMIAVQINDPLTGWVVEIETIYGMQPTGDALPLLTILPDAIYYSHPCYPAATGRNEKLLGGSFDTSTFEPRLAIECIGLDQDAVNIAFGLSRANHIEVTGPSTLALMRGDDEIMTLRLLN